jgi:hypothetical protein
VDNLIHRDDRENASCRNATITLGFDDPAKKQEPISVIVVLIANERAHLCHGLQSGLFVAATSFSLGSFSHRSQLKGKFESSVRKSSR